jgi:hypothetical protein
LTYISGSVSTTFVVSDNYDSNSLANYEITPDGDSTVPVSYNLAAEAPSVGPPSPGVGTFGLSYSFGAGWRFLRVGQVSGGSLINTTSVSQIVYWIYGDNSGNFARLRIYDSNNQYFQPNGVTINWTVKFF